MLLQRVGMWGVTVLVMMFTAPVGGGTPARSVYVSDLQNLATTHKELSQNLAVLNQRVQTYRTATGKVVAFDRKVRLQIEDVAKRARAARDAGTVESRTQLLDAISQLKELLDQRADNLTRGVELSQFELAEAMDTLEVSRRKAELAMCAVVGRTTPSITSSVQYVCP